MGCYPGGNTPAGHVKFVRDRVNELTNPALPVDQKIIAAQKIFSDDNIQMLNKYRDADSRNKVFSMLVSPEVTKNMLAAKDKDPKVGITTPSGLLTHSVLSTVR